MNCKYCNNQINDDFKVCPYCGKSLVENQIVSQESTQSQEQTLSQQVTPQVPFQQQSKIQQSDTINTQQTTNNNSNKKNMLTIITVIIVFVLLVSLIFGGSILYKKVKSESNDTNLVYDSDGAFLMTIEDVFTITGRGTVVTGKIERGTINLNDQVQVVGLDHEVKTTTVTGIESFRKTQETATVGDNVGMLLKDVERDEVEKGQVVAKPNTIKAYKKFDADVYVLTQEEGGRNTPIFNNSSPHFNFKVVDINGVVTLPKNVKSASPGDNVKLTVELQKSVATEVGREFNIKEGGRVIASGKITKVY